MITLYLLLALYGVAVALAELVFIIGILNPALATGEKMPGKVGVLFILFAMIMVSDLFLELVILERPNAIGTVVHFQFSIWLMFVSPKIARLVERRKRGIIELIRQVIPR